MNHRYFWWFISPLILVGDHVGTVVDLVMAFKVDLVLPKHLIDGYELVFRASVDLGGFLNEFFTLSLFEIFILVTIPCNHARIISNLTGA